METDYRKVTRKELAVGAFDRWRQQYGDPPPPSSPYDKLGPYLKLKGMTDPTPEEVNQAIGNTSWTDLQCDFCRANVEEILEMETDENRISICTSCLKQAAKLMDM
jgi:hypothetical protein